MKEQGKIFNDKAEEAAAFQDFPNPMEAEVGPLGTKVKAAAAYNDETELANPRTRVDDDVEPEEGE